MSLKHAILGFLAYQPMTGYDLKKAFDHSIRHFWPANQSQIYRTLAELNDDNLVEMDVIEREDRLDMKVYHVTAAGREELARWLSTPLPLQDYREPFLIQVYFGSQIPAEKLLVLLEHELRELEGLLAVYNAIYGQYQQQFNNQPDSPAAFLSLSTLEYGILSNQAAVAWLKSLIARVKSGNYSLKGI